MTLADGVLSLIVAVLFVVILGVMRELVILRGEVRSPVNLITQPPPPAIVGETLPPSLHENLLAGPDDELVAGAVAFITPSCGGCDDLVSAYLTSLNSGRFASSDLAFVVANAEGSAPAVENLIGAGVTVVPDPLLSERGPQFHRANATSRASGRALHSTRPVCTR